MSGKFKVRFHLGKGEHFRHFQITYPDGNRKFYNPEDTFIVMENARLHNNCKIAEQIHNGRNKTVCSWIACDSIKVEGIMGYLFSTDERPIGIGHSELQYNPRLNPHWLENGENVDFKKYKRLFTEEDRIFVGV